MEAHKRIDWAGTLSRKSGAEPEAASAFNTQKRPLSLSHSSRCLNCWWHCYKHVLAAASKAHIPSTETPATPSVTLTSACRSHKPAIVVGLDVSYMLGDRLRVVKPIHPSWSFEMKICSCVINVLEFFLFLLFFNAEARSICFSIFWTLSQTFTLTGLINYWWSEVKRYVWNWYTTR